MAFNVLSKEEFVYKVMESQKARKELGMKLQTISDSEFDQIMSNLWLELRQTNEKNTKNVTRKAKKVKEDVTTITNECVTVKTGEIKKETKKDKTSTNYDDVFKIKEVHCKNGIIQLAFDF